MAANAPTVRRAKTAHPADCGHWLPVGARFLVLSSGRTLCALCGLSCVTDPNERKALLANDTDEQPH